MSIIATVEDTIMTACAAALVDKRKRPYVRTVITIPGGWTVDTLKRMLQGAPGVYVAWLGGTVKKDYNEVYNVGRFDAVVVNYSGKEMDRRLGTKSQIGAYDIVERITPALHGLKIDNVGTLTVERINNLFNESTFDLGATIYAVQCAVPMHFAAPVNHSLDDFNTFDVDYDIRAFVGTEEHTKWLKDDHSTSKPDAQDTVILEQG